MIMVHFLSLDFTNFQYTAVMPYLYACPQSVWL